MLHVSFDSSGIQDSLFKFCTLLTADTERYVYNIGHAKKEMQNEYLQLANDI